MEPTIDQPPWRAAPPGVGPSTPIQPAHRDRERQQRERGQRRVPRNQTPEESEDVVPDGDGEPLPDGGQRRVDIVA